jgi:hypothetical protein
MLVTWPSFNDGDRIAGCNGGFVEERGQNASADTMFDPQAVQNLARRFYHIFDGVLASCDEQPIGADPPPRTASIRV